MNFTEENILLNVERATKEELLQFISEYALEIGVATNVKEVMEDFLQREKEVSTGFTHGIAIPHAKSVAVTKCFVLYIRTKEGIDWGTLDESAVTDVFAVFVPKENSSALHLKVISSLAEELIEPEFIEVIRCLNTSSELANYLNKKLRK
ncbi:PTS sugar transporter subunit IIA [Pilibacter termitis]|nr:fructose PTS transporter subunit IIA [Pilibacter termitis]